MKWDAEKRRYVENGRVVREAEVRKHVDDYITNEQKEVERKAEKLLAGALTVAAFFEFLRHKITSWHSVAGSLAYGGPENTSPEQWSRINSKILSELEYLNKFETQAQASFDASQATAADLISTIGEKIPAGLETLVEERVSEALLTAAPSTAEATIRQTIANVLADSVGREEAQAVASGIQVAEVPELIGATIPSRAQMYTDAAFSTYTNNVAGREEDAGAVGVRRVCADDEASCDECVDAASDDYGSFADFIDIGTLTCLNNCRCYPEFSYEGVEPLIVDRRLTG